MMNSQTKATLLHDPTTKINSTQTFMYRTCHTHELKHCHSFQIFGFKSMKTQNITDIALFYNFTKIYTYTTENKHWIQLLLQKTKSIGRTTRFHKMVFNFSMSCFTKNIVPLKSSFQLLISILLLAFPSHNTSTQRIRKKFMNQHMLYDKLGIEELE